jgi:hypothetical protein
MSLIYIPNQHQATSHSLAGLVGSRTEAERISARIARTVEASYLEDARREGGRPVHRTAAEDKRRINICFDWFKEMRGGGNWSLTRTLDTIPEALRSELDGTPYSMPTQRMWVPGGMN